MRVHHSTLRLRGWPSVMDGRSSTLERNDMPTSPPVHKRQSAGRRHERDRQRTRALNTGSKAWRAIRAAVLARDSYLCQSCGRFGDQVDHINGDSHDNREANFQTLCLRCHSRKTARETFGDPLGGVPK